MLIAIHTTPGLGRVVSLLDFPPGVIVLPRCESSTISDTIRLGIQRLKQLENFSQSKTIVCIDWFEAPEDASPIEQKFLKTHAAAFEKMTPHTCTRVFLDIEPSYAFEMLIREGSTIAGSGCLERPCGGGYRVIPVGRHEFDTTTFRDRLVSQILNV